MEWKKIDEKLIKGGFRKISSKTFILPDGRNKSFEIKEEGEAVSILALTKERKAVMTKQFRPGPEKVLLELPGGSVDEGETFEAAAKRELLEETGYTGEIKFVGSLIDCAYSTLIRYVFVATGCEKIAEQNLDNSEFIEVVEMSLEDFRNHLRSGQLTNVEAGYLGLDFLKLL